AVQAADPPDADCRPTAGRVGERTGSPEGRAGATLTLTLGADLLANEALAALGATDAALREPMAGLAGAGDAEQPVRCQRATLVPGVTEPAGKGTAAARDRGRKGPLAGPVPAAVLRPHAGLSPH